MKREVTTCDVCKKEFNPGKGINLSIVAFWERAVERDVCSFACLERCAQIEAERVRVRDEEWDQIAEEKQDKEMSCTL